MARGGEVHRYPVDHVDLCQSDHVARAVTAQVWLFSRHLRPVPGPDADATGREAG